MATFAINDGTGFQMSYEVHEGLVPENTLFIHGNLASNRWWSPTEEVLRKKAKGKGWTGKFVTAEFRGCGKSSPPKSEAEVDMSLFARDYVALVRGLRLGPTHVVGHSTGGLIAALMMAAAPELFKKAVLLDPVGAKGVTFDPSMIAAFEQMKKDRNLVSAVIGSTIHGNDPTTDFFNQVIVEDAFSSVKSVGHLVLKALDGLDSREKVSSVTHPTLVLHGEVDTLLPMSGSKELAGLMKNGRFEVIAGRGHCSNVEDANGFVERFEKFLFES